MTASPSADWLDRLLFHHGPGIYVAAQDQPGDELADSVRSRGWLYLHGTLEDATDKASLLTALGRALDAFPDWGQNWDALVDVLRDLPEAAGYVLVLDNCGQPASRCAAEWATLIDIFGDHIDDGDDNPTQPPLRVVLRDDDRRSGYCPA